MSDQSTRPTREEIELLFRYVYATMKASRTDGTVSCVCKLRGDSETWYVLVDGQFLFQDLSEWEAYQSTHGTITPLH